MRTLGGFWWLTLLVVLHGACSSSSSGGSGGGTGSDGGPRFGTSACGSCVASACQSERTACLSDPGCASFVSCLDACPLAADGNAESSCVAACPTPSSSTGANAKTALEACRTSGPGAACSACGADAGGDADASSSQNPILAPQNCQPSTNTGCSGCMDNFCCKLMTACNGDPDCVAIVNCVGGCGSSWDCESACYTAHPNAVAKYSQYYGCVNVFCPGTDQDCQAAPNATIECIVMKDCKQEFTDCYSNADCYLITQCEMNCASGDTTCIEGCKQAHPNGADAFGAMTLCWEKKCAYTQ